MTEDLAHVFPLDECRNWIVKNGFKRVILQFKAEHLKDANKVVDYLQGNNAKSNHLLDLYVTQSNTCCVDLIVTQHVSNVDAVIHFGKACLSRPHLENKQNIPVLFAFTRLKQESTNFNANLESIVEHMRSLVQTNSNCPTCVFYDTSCVDYAQAIQKILEAEKEMSESLEVAKLLVPSPEWFTTANESLVIREANHRIGQFSMSRCLDDYKSAICLSAKPSINLTLQMPSNFWKIDCNDKVLIEKVNVSRVLNKRMALVNRLRDDQELKFGVIITNPLPDIGETLTRLNNYARVRKHELYPISMIQTIDECKIGNFDLCDAFIVVNACTCSTILESLYFNRPIISDIEFRLACGFEGVYGRVLWPSSDTNLSADDLMNKRKVSDVSLALIHSRNELLERCSEARINLWSGLDFKTGTDPTDVSLANLTIEDGLHGIASTYKSEPLERQPEDGDKRS